MPVLSHEWIAAILRGRPVVVVEDPTDSLPPSNRARRSLRGRTVDQLVRQSLMIAFAVVVHRELLQCLTEVPLAERHEAVQAFFFH